MSSHTTILSFDVEATGQVPNMVTPQSSRAGSLNMLGTVEIRFPTGTTPTTRHICHKRRWFIKELGPMETKCEEEFWKKHEDNLTLIREKAVAPETAFADFASYVREIKAHGDELKFMAGPSCFDWMWLCTYYANFAPADAPGLGHQCICLSSLKIALGKLIPRTAIDAAMTPPAHAKMTHLADDDAEYQAYQYVGLENLFKQLAEKTK